MDDARVGAAFRAVRVRRGWRQVDVAQKARAHVSAVSLVERGHLDGVSPRTLRRIAIALEVRIEYTLRLPHGELEHLLSAGHAVMHEALAKHLSALPDWLHAPEVSFAVYGERGVIDILAFHPPTGSLLVIELKTEIVSIEDLLMTMDVRIRHAADIARARGWQPQTVSAWVVVAESDLNRRRVRRHSTVLRSAFPADGRTMRCWLQRPRGAIRTLSFWANFGHATTTQKVATRRRVRTRARHARPVLTA